MPRFLASFTDSRLRSLALSEIAGVMPVMWNQVAPSSALVSIRTNWIPYILQAVEAVKNGVTIESVVDAHAHGRDMSAGFESGWVQLLELNRMMLDEDAQEQVNNAVEDMIKGHIQVFSGDYTGVNPRDPSDTIDLRDGYRENQTSSNPSFGYILRDCVIVEN